MKGDFGEWLSTRLKMRGWSIRELGRRSNLAHSTISRVIDGSSAPTWEFCSAIAGALHIPTIDVFHRAGLLPWPDEGQAALQDLIMVADRLPEEKQREVARYARFLMEE